MRGNLVKIVVTIVDSTIPTPQLVDPTQVLAEYVGADGVIHLPVVSRDSVGLYHYTVDTFLLPVAQRQVCRRRAYAPDGDPAQFVCEGAFAVTSGPPFSP